MADIPGLGRHRSTGIAIGNKGYIGLGHYNGTGNNIMLDDWWEYDPSNNTWTQKADYPSLNYAALAFGMSTKGYVGGGITGGNSFFEYDPMQNIWTPKASLPDAISDSQGFVIDDKAYYFDNGQTYEYNPLIDTWNIKGPIPFGGAFWNASFVIEDKGYIQDGSVFYEYKPLTDSWLIRPNFPGSTGSATVGFSQNGKGYIVSGFGGSLSNVSSEFWSFDPNTNAWTQLEDFPGTSRRFASGFNIGNKAYLGIGTNGTNFSDFWSFDLLAETDDLKISNVKCFPNPTSEEITVSWEKQGFIDLKIIALNGRVMVSKSSQSGTFKTNCSMWPNGNYIITLSDEDGHSVTETLTVQ
jgi:N-acetylneuraminic acid mutarotase